MPITPKTGSLFHAETHISYVTRRDIAETIRFIPEAENPSDEDLAGFRAYMNPPDVEALGG
ncbi:hypothetical protein J4G48_0006495 [Bradyrhizobium barranii subsp. apii]|uniref:hypothetical protein n=1 Tax=Bradyrhizobium barranii TaxID=2992140 RepID=UPI001AA17A55|nr:hypothetical protein [Bradyrhizobium barranii]UPT97740.1 hypothetical protein J4G48_0006495 [Bradyrhizobium barranii subsp. apii]